MNKCFLAVAIIMCFQVFACGTSEPEGQAERLENIVLREENDYYPMRVGDSWRYKEKDIYNNVSTLVYEVVGRETIDFGRETGKREVLLLENTLPDKPEEYRIQYIEDDGVRAVRHRHLIYDEKGTLTKTRDFVPGFLRFDRDKVRVGDTWTEDVTKYTDSLEGLGEQTTHTKYQYEVVAVDEPVTVVAGTFRCLRIRRTELMGSEVKEYYFGFGVGKVKEVTEGVKEETLQRYTLAAQ